MDSGKNNKPAQAQAKTKTNARRTDLPLKASTSQTANASFAARMAAQSTATTRPLRRVPPASTRPPRDRTFSSATAPTNSSRQRQANVGQKPPVPSTRQNTSSSLNDRAAWTKPRMAPRPASSRTAASNASSNSSIAHGLASERPLVRESTSSSSTVEEDRPLPPLPLTPSRQAKHHRSLPPPGPLSKRPLLPLNERQPIRSGASTSPARAPSTAFEPRRFHMHGQTYDDAMAPLKAKAEADAARGQTKSAPRPHSRSTQLARIGPMTEAEKAQADGQPLGKDAEVPIDVNKFVSIGYQPVPKATTGNQPKPARICIASDCKGVLCRVCTPMVLRFQTPEQKAAEEQERRQLLSNSLQMRKPDLWSPKFSSPLRQSHPSSPRPDSDDERANPATTTPAETSEELLEWDIEVIKASRAKANIEIYENDEPLLGYNVEALKESNGWGEARNEPLLEWDIEAIKASQTRTFKKPATTVTSEKKKKKKKTVRFCDPSSLSSSASSSSHHSSSTNSKTNICWDKDPRANRAADASSSTAIPFLIKALNLLPPQAKEKYGVVAIDSVVQKRPQITTSHHSGSDDDAGSESSFLAAAQYAEFEDYTGDYTDSWPESSYYFSSRDSMPTIDESPRQARQHSVATTRSSTSEKPQWQARQRDASRRDASHDNMF
ncbi:hypothetical protein F503_07236 [Ophiostoma piceae UAMH 11346]|uniref:Uncharacterized protein n=1 Tax=Ophiostoma piceae (strain UAMH 11346) TaxID=1262450 RepID=S3D7Q6_OPHP1|nr:hypothetical protein F503_07236 [Ophiostoma piceae UAMH 11346]